MNITWVIDEMVDRVHDAGIMKLSEGTEKERIQDLMNRLALTVVKARVLVESGKAPRHITHHLVATSEARMCGFLLAVLTLQKGSLLGEEER